VRAALLGGGATLAIMLTPWLRFAYASVTLHVAFETAAASIALLAAYLVLGHFRQNRELDSLLLACGLGVMGCVNLLLTALPAALDLEPGGAAAWTAAIGRLLATALLVGAAFSPRKRLENHRLERLTFLLAANVLGALWLVVGFSRGRLPLALDPSLSPENSSGPEFVAHPLVHGVQLLGAALFALAAIGFLQRAARDEISRWLAPACVLAAFASIHYFLFPSLYSRWFYVGDIFRLGFYVLLVAGAAREISRSQDLLRRLAVLDERRRIARDLHDGLAQELAYIATTSRDLADRADAAPEIARLSGAAERALDESRRAIVALRGENEPLDAAVARAAFEVANRVGTKLSLELDPGMHLGGDVQEQLVRIVREAVTNAARHGRAAHVRVTLANGNGIRLAVVDDGSGFDPEHVGDRGFGLVSMRERARAIGGDLTVTSRPAAGTEIELVLPDPAAS
jgi:signal transduction histidine kinase